MKIEDIKIGMRVGRTIEGRVVVGNVVNIFEENDEMLITYITDGGQDITTRPNKILGVYCVN